MTDQGTPTNVPPNEILRSSITSGVAQDRDAEQPLLPLLLATLAVRDLVPEDFPDGRALEWAEQVQLIEAALGLAARRSDRPGALECAELMAEACGFQARRYRGRVEWALRKWIKGMQAAMAGPVAGRTDTSMDSNPLPSGAMGSAVNVPHVIVHEDDLDPRDP
jgi:hypothetical protein